MTQPGWYPDPAGRPQTYRYWDGARWSDETTGNPYDAPPGAAPAPPAYPPAPSGPPPAAATGYGAPPPQQGGYGQGGPGGYGQPPYGAGYPSAAQPEGRGSGPSGTTIALVVVAVLVILCLGVGGFVLAKALTDDSGSTAGGEKTTGAAEDPTGGTDETTGPTDDASGSGPTDQQCFGGLPTPAVTPRQGAARVSGGDLTIPVPDGYQPNVDYSTNFTWADDFTPLLHTIAEGEASGWVSVYGVGALNRANGFDSPEQAAEVVMACMSASPDLYQGFSGRSDVSSEEVTIDGSPAWSLTSELRVDSEFDVEGDVAQVIVVDTGEEDTYGLYITVVPIGDDALIAEQEAMVDQIKVG